jgi:hypothetical protein
MDPRSVVPANRGTIVCVTDFQNGPISMRPAVPAGWYPDPARAHEFRYYDGMWTDHVSDAGQASQHPLGPVPPGMLQWFPPDIMVRNAIAGPRPVEVPRVKMWVLAVLSAFVFFVNTIVLPLGVIFAIWCWTTTSEAFRSQRSTGSPGATEIRAARWLAVVLALFSLAQFAFAAFNVGGSFVVWSR